MSNEDLHNIKIDDLDSPKKTPLKNILTLLALLFIILVISVVITKLILNTDEGTTIENNDSQSQFLSDANKTTGSDADAKKDADSKSDDNKDSDSKNSDSKDADSKNDTAKKDAASNVKVPVISNNIIERNLTSVIKTPLSSHVPKKEPKEIKTYSTPKKNTSTQTASTPKKEVAPKKTYVAPKKEVTPKKAYVAPKKNTTPKKEYIDKVVAKKNTASTSSSSSKKASYLGGKRIDVTDSYYIKVGTYRNPTTIINKVKKNNFNYAVVKVENDKTLLRVLVGPFFSRNQANAQLAKVKANILTGAYVTKAK